MGVEMTDILELAKRVEALEYFKCPMCGDGDFDIDGFLNSHIHGAYGCPVAYHFDSGSNADFAAALRAKDANNEQ